MNFGQEDRVIRKPHLSRSGELKIREAIKDYMSFIFLLIYALLLIQTLWFWVSLYHCLSKLKQEQLNSTWTTYFYVNVDNLCYRKSKKIICTLLLLFLLLVCPLSTQFLNFGSVNRDIIFVLSYIKHFVSNNCI